MNTPTRTHIAMIAAVATAAVMAAGFVARATPAQTVPVVHFETVVVTGHRSELAAAERTPQIIQLPTVVITAKRSADPTLLAEKEPRNAVPKSAV